MTSLAPGLFHHRYQVSWTFSKHLSCAHPHRKNPTTTTESNQKSRLVPSHSSHPISAGTAGLFVFECKFELFSILL